MTSLTVIDNDDGLLHLEGAPLSVLGLAHVDTTDGATVAVDLLTFDLHALTVDLDAAVGTPAVLCRATHDELRQLEPGDRLDVEWNPFDGKSVVGTALADGLDPLHPAAAVLRAEVARLTGGRPLADLLPSAVGGPVDPTLVETLAWTGPHVARMLSLLFTGTAAGTRAAEIFATLQERTPPSSGRMAPRGGRGGEDDGVHTVVSLGSDLVVWPTDDGPEVPALADLGSAGPEVIPNLISLRAVRRPMEISVSAAPLSAAALGPTRLWCRLFTEAGDVAGVSALQAGPDTTMVATLPAHPDGAWVELTADATATSTRSRVAHRQLRVVLQEHRQRAAIANLVEATRLDGAAALAAHARRVQEAGRLDPGLVLGRRSFPVFNGPGAAPSDIALVGELADPDGDGLRPGIHPAFGPSS